MGKKYSPTLKSFKKAGFDVAHQTELKISALYVENGKCFAL